MWNVAKSEILDWMGTELAGLKASGAFALAEVSITGVRIATMEVEHGTGLSAPGGEYEIEASAVDIDRQFEGAVGLARFVERHGHLFGRIQLIRRRHAPAGGDAFFRLEINRTAMQKKLLLVTTNPQLDALFAAEAISVGSSGG